VDVPGPRVGRHLLLEVVVEVQALAAHLFLDLAVGRAVLREEAILWVVEHLKDVEHVLSQMGLTLELLLTVRARLKLDGGKPLRLLSLSPLERRRGMRMRPKAILEVEVLILAHWRELDSNTSSWLLA
jgi:hypothetical protein